MIPRETNKVVSTAGKVLLKEVFVFLILKSQVASHVHLVPFVEVSAKYIPGVRIEEDFIRGREKFVALLRKYLAKEPAYTSSS